MEWMNPHFFKCNGTVCNESQADPTPRDLWNIHHHENSNLQTEDGCDGSRDVGSDACVIVTVNF